MTMIFRGAVDVGTSGGFVFLDLPLQELHLFDAPTKAVPILKPKGDKIKNRNEYDKALIGETFKKYRGARIMIERIRAWGGDKKKPFALASMMEGFGTYDSAAQAAMMDCHYVEPRSWKAAIMRGKGGTKAKPVPMRNVAQHLFPMAANLMTNATDHSGRVAALLLLYYDMLGDQVITAKKAPPPLHPVELKRVMINGTVFWEAEVPVGTPGLL